MAATEGTPRVEALKEAGNDALKGGDMVGAMKFYSAAIKLAPKNHSLYSNRSLARLKTGRYAGALEDAQKVIKIKPGWVKGYFRAGEVYATTENYADAVNSYKAGLAVEPADETVKARLEAAQGKLRLQAAAMQTMPLKASVGMVVAGLIVIYLDSTVEVTPPFGLDPGRGPMMSSGVARILVCAICAAVGFGVGTGVNWWSVNKRQSFLDPTLIEDDAVPAGMGGPVPAGGGAGSAGSAGGATKRRTFKKVANKPPGVGKSPSAKK